MKATGLEMKIDVHPKSGFLIYTRIKYDTRYRGVSDDWLCNDFTLIPAYIYIYYVVIPKEYCKTLTI